MRKALRIIAITSGIVSVVSAVVLGCVYLEDIIGYLNKSFNKTRKKLHIGEENDYK